MSSVISRREFLRRSLTVGATAGLSAGSWNLVRGANDTIRVGVCGFGGRGRAHIDGFNKIPGVRVVALCDADSKILARGVADVEKRGQKVEAYTDVRKMLDNKDIDLVSTATPNHWHSLFIVWACQAGKDVYVEKPLSLTIREGRLMVEAARKYKRVFQTGSQQRSMRDNRIGCALVREGAIGRVHTVIGANYPSPWNCAFPGQPVPDGLDWDMWCGPVEPVPFNKDLFLPRAKPGWISFRPYSGGEMTGWGAHGLDQIQWALGMDE
ncbi:MAG: Gfo/Idh/MocA family oxidoreductase, partial [Verrucomicrobiae bacterium]|nr:Gfo/Idh/MocA family oxidoreductase [Verrucomicrobiae bacterium]